MALSILVQLSGCCGERQILLCGADSYFSNCQESPTIDTLSRVVQTLLSVVQIVIETIESYLGFAHPTLRPFIKIYRKQLSSDYSKSLRGKEFFPTMTKAYQFF